MNVRALKFVAKVVFCLILLRFAPMVSAVLSLYLMEQYFS